MQPQPEAVGAGRRWSRRGALALSGLLPLVDLSVVVLVEPLPGLVAAVGVVLLVLPLHLWVVAHALSGARARGAGWSLVALVALVALTLLAMTLVQTTWSFLFSSLAVSVLLVLPAGWSLLGVGAVVALAWADGALSFAADASPGTSVHVLLVIVFRALCLYTVVRLVAQLDRLDAARARVAEQAVEHERARTALELTRSLGPDLERISARGASLSSSRDGDAVAAEVAAIADGCRVALLRVRDIVARTRDKAARRALAEAGRRLRADPADAAPPRTAPARQVPRESARRAIGLFVLVRLGLLAMMLFFVSGIGAAEGPPSWLSVAAVVVVALELPLALRTSLAAPGAPVGRAGLLLASAITAASVTGVLLLPDPSPVLLCLAFVSSAAVMVLPPPARLAGTLGPLLLLGYAGHHAFSLYPPATHQLGFALSLLLGYLPAVHLLAVGALVASAYLVRSVIGMERTRTGVVEEAVDAESRRFARDLHDTLVQRLSAIALTADLVQRLLVLDPRAAAAELAGLGELTDGLAEEALETGHDRRAVTLAEEARTAVRLLRAAGVRADVRLPATAPAPEVDTLLGWALREAATNVVRHSEATRCSIVVSADQDTTDLVITNDGACASRTGPARGNGLAGLGERVRAVSGSVSAELAEPGQFRLSVSVPARS